jgi:hypothetical protein
VAHDAGGLLLLKEGDKTTKGEVEEVVTRQDEQVLVDFLLFHGEEDVPDRPEPVGVVGRTVIEDDDGMGKRAALFPGSEVIEELVVGNNHILPNPFDAIDIREEPVKDGPSLYIQEGLGKVLGQGMEPGCIAGYEVV